MTDHILLTLNAMCGLIFHIILCNSMSLITVVLFAGKSVVPVRWAAVVMAAAVDAPRWLHASPPQ